MAVCRSRKKSSLQTLAQGLLIHVVLQGGITVFTETAQGARVRMEKGIVVLDANEKQCQKLCAMLEERNYGAIPMYFPSELQEYLQVSTCRVVILDLDTVAVNNRMLGEFRRKNPQVCIVGLSKRQFHPELKEAMSTHIYACLRKPLDPEELIYVLRSTCV